MPLPQAAAMMKPPMPGAMPASAAGGPGMGGPTPTPMSTPQPAAGLEKAARVEVQMAVQMLMRTMPRLEFGGEQWKAVQNAVGALGKAFGKTEEQDRELIPAEVRQLLSQVGPGTASPGQNAMARAPVPGVGGPPPGAPAPPQ